MMVFNMNSKITKSEISRLKSIYENPLWIECVAKIEKLEEERIFCKHNREHFMDVARIAYILALEENLNIKKDVIYAAALLHDIGRADEYKNGISHDIAGTVLAGRILKKSEFSENEQKMILCAIRQHRNSSENDINGLNSIIYRADKKSRMCLYCKAREECYWPADKKNDVITY